MRLQPLPRHLRRHCLARLLPVREAQTQSNVPPSRRKTEGRKQRESLGRISSLASPAAALGVLATTLRSRKSLALAPIVRSRLVGRRVSEKLTILESLMRECEDAINGEPIDGRKSLELVARLREVERALGLRMRSRETRQAAEGLQQNSLL